MREANTSSSRRLQVMIATGLLVISGSSILHRHVQMPDIVLGGITGAGIGIMILGIVWAKPQTPKSA